MKTVSTFAYRSPYGELLLGDFEGYLCLCDWTYRKMRQTIDNRIQRLLGAEYKNDNTPLIEATISQLEAYFAGECTEFSIPLLLAGSDFQKSVWELLLKIPYGETRSYIHLAKKLHNEKALRAVAAANGANALSIFVPCHRVIGSDGRLVGYAGGMEVKRKLLLLESSEKVTTQLRLF